MKSRKKTIRRCGHVWNSSDHYYDNDWHTTIDERFHISTWKFGSIHQAKVFVDYEHKIDGQALNSIKNDGSIGICLRPGKTIEEAMQIGLDWVEKFKQTGPDSVDKVFKDSWEHWPTLYPNENRIAVIDHLLFVIGGGYGWVDGAIMCLSPDDYLEFINRRENDKELQKVLDETKKLREMMRQLKLDRGEDSEDDLDSVRSKYWTMGTYMFYPVSKDYSNICLVPDDVKPEWLALAYEAALLLRDKSGVPDIKSKWFTKSEDDHKRQEENRKLGTEIVAELERRFPHVAQKSK